MAKPPQLSPIEVDIVQLGWEAAIEESGFTGPHLAWPNGPHESPEKWQKTTRALGRRPPPPESSNYQDWFATVQAHVGIEDSERLAVKLFDVLAGVYFERWKRGGTRHDAFAGWLDSNEMQTAVLVKLRELWAPRRIALSRLHDEEWFEESCESYVTAALDRRAAVWRRKKARDEYRERLNEKRKRPKRKRRKTLAPIIAVTTPGREPPPEPAPSSAHYPASTEADAKVRLLGASPPAQPDSSLEPWNERLRKARRAKGLSRPEVAKALGCSIDTVRNHERDRAFPSVKRQEAYATLYGVDAGELFAGCGHPLKPRT